ncbi:MAG: aldehyde dehydrogenase [Prevotella sp.]|nr:aldehyde dehydrogenase [Prevotella sp.]
MADEAIRKIYQQQRAHMGQSPLRQPRYRIQKLRQLYRNIKMMQDEICEALHMDLNKSAVESYMTEIGLVLSEISYMKKHLRRFAKPQRVHTPLAQFAAKSFRLPCPKGQVLIISPWNYPFMLSIEPLVDAIAAGNCVILKPSENSPHVSAVIQKLLQKTFDSDDVLTVIGGREQCAFLLDLDFDHIFFTGSTRVGQIVAQKAAEHFTTVTLELGGKSPCIVDETAKIKLAAKRIVFGKFLNCGQTCVAPDYLLCHRSVRDQLVREIERQIVLQYSVDPLRNPDYPKMIHQKQFDAVKNLITADNVIFGGRFNADTLQIEPTLVSADFDSPSMQAEIFGPVFPVITYDDFDALLQKINTLHHPLAFYVFSSNQRHIRQALTTCDFGGGCVNDCVIHLATSAMPFGGLKHSGIGGYHGKVGFETFSHFKSIVDKKTWLDLPLRYQPYSKTKAKLIKTFVK